MGQTGGRAGCSPPAVASLRWLDAAPEAGCGPCHHLPHPCSSSSLCCSHPADAGGERQQETRSLGFLRIYHRPRQPRKGTEQQMCLAALRLLPLCYETPKTTGGVSWGGWRHSDPALINTPGGSSSHCLFAFLFFFFFLTDKIHFWDCLL